MIITGKTKNLGIIGCPVEHSLSPVMQNAALQELGLDYNYIAMPVLPENLGQAISGLKALGFCGINVTIPHKVNVIQYLDETREEIIQEPVYIEDERKGTILEIAMQYNNSFSENIHSYVNNINTIGI